MQNKPNLKHKLKNQSRKANIQLAAVVIFLISAFTLSQCMKNDNGKHNITNKNSSEIFVEAITVKPTAHPVKISTTGTIRVRNQIEIIPQVSGKVVKVDEKFREGGTFEANKPIFTINKERYIYKVNSFKAEVETARTNLALQRAEADAAMEEWKALHGDEQIPDLVAKKPQLQQAEAQLDSAQAKLSEAQMDLRRTDYRLPFPGRVVESRVEVGQYLQSGQIYGSLYSDDALEVVAPIEDYKLGWLDIENSKAEIKTSYLGNEITLEGKISRIGSTLDSDTRLVNLIITPSGDGWKKLIPGMFSAITLIGADRQDLWLLPNSVLQENNKIWLIKPDNTLVLYSPEIISIGEEYTLAKGTGTEARIVKGMVEGASAGMKVKIINDKNETNKQAEIGSK